MKKVLLYCLKIVFFLLIFIILLIAGCSIIIALNYIDRPEALVPLISGCLIIIFLIVIILKILFRAPPAQKYIYSPK